MSNDLLHINGHILHADNINSQQASAALPQELLDFLCDWYSESECIILQTSGSTGKPSLFRAKKTQMRASAALSCRALQLHAKSRILLSLPLGYIAAKMMLIRAIVGALEIQLIPASSDIFAQIPLGVSFDFAPLVPHQAASLPLHELERIRCILLGGGFIPPALEEKLSHHNGRVYASYGMTETLSHIALRRINGAEASPDYSPLEGVRIQINTEGCLQIDVPHLDIVALKTRDLGSVSPQGKIQLLGRADNIINSGGIKIHAEEIEHTLSEATGLSLVALGQAHPSLGESLTVLWEGELSQEIELRHAIKETLSRYLRPKSIYHIPQGLPRTSSHKISRGACKKLLLELESKPVEPSK